MTAVSETTTVAHPLEPLTAEEISATAAITLRSCSPGGSVDAILMAPGLMPVEPIPLQISWR